MSQYPKTVTEVLNPSRKYKASVLQAMRKFRKSKPWKGGLVTRLEKLEKLHAELCQAYGLSINLYIGRAGFDCYDRFSNTIHLTQVSVVTYLHEFAHAAFGPSEKKACSWSINLFKRIFPKRFARLRQDGHMLRAR